MGYNLTVSRNCGRIEFCKRWMHTQRAVESLQSYCAEVLMNKVSTHAPDADMQALLLAHLEPTSQRGDGKRMAASERVATSQRRQSGQRSAAVAQGHRREPRKTPKSRVLAVLAVVPTVQAKGSNGFSSSLGASGQAKPI